VLDAAIATKKGRLLSVSKTADPLSFLSSGGIPDGDSEQQALGPGTRRGPKSAPRGIGLLGSGAPMASVQGRSCPRL
jgi:hypothetical protein